MKVIEPRCVDNSLATIDPEGRWKPCCFHSKTVFNRPKDKIFETDEYLLSKNERADEFHKKKSFLDWIEDVKNDYDGAPSACKNLCSKKLNRVESESRYLLEVNKISNEFELFCFLDDHAPDS